MKFNYKTNGVCSKSIDIEIENDKIESVHFVSGCEGNLKAVGTLTKGMTVDEVIERLSGIKCGFKSTSCPDQLAAALKEYKSTLAK